MAGFSPLAGIRYVETCKLSHDEICLEFVSVPLRGLDMWKLLLTSSDKNISWALVSVPLRGLDMWKQFPYNRSSHY